MRVEAERSRCALAFASAVLLSCVSCNGRQPNDSSRSVASTAEALTSPGDYRSLILSDGPVGYWRLGDSQTNGDRTARDETPTANNGTYTGRYPDTAPPVPNEPGATLGDSNTSALFTLSNNYNHVPPTQDSYVVIAHKANQAPTRPELTLEAWFTMTPGAIAQTYSAVISKSTANLLDGYGIYWSGGALYFFINNLNIRTGVLAASIGDASQFHHVVGVYNGTTIAIYLDGVLASTRGLGVVEGLGRPVNASSAPFQIGKGYGLGWQGRIDEVAVYDHVLSLAQIQAHFQAARPAGPVLREFVAYADRSLTLGSGVHVTWGDLGVASVAPAGGGPQSTVGALDSIDVRRTLFSPSVVLGPLAQVGAVATNALTNQGGTLTAQQAYPSSRMPRIPRLPGATPGTTNITVLLGKTQTISPGNYGALVNYGTVRLSSGLYSFSSITLGDKASFNALSWGKTTVRVATTFQTGLGASVVQGATRVAGDFVISVDGADPSPTRAVVSIGALNQISAVISAPNGTIAFGDTTAIAGAISAYAIKLGNNDSLNYNSGFTSDKQCASDADCKDGLVCGHGNGAFFGRARIENVCWPPKCEDDPFVACGTANAPCGSTCSAQPACQTNSDCGPGYVCGSNNGLLFSSQPGNVCWPASCATDPVGTGCGDVFSQCGKCRCIPSCNAATCGGSMGDGCGGRCEQTCADRQPGCLVDTDCSRGSKCIINGGSRVGLAAGSNVCLPASCADIDPKRAGVCGATSSTCGTCPACVPDCGGRSCGPDPRCGVSCGTCPSGAFCADVGQCLAAVPNGPITVPDGQGGSRSIAPLDSPSTQPVGAMDGSFSVTDRGTAMYSIPIAVPPGRAGMQPELELRYESSKTNGFLGVGWSLQGLSMITRCAKTEGRDGWASDPDFGGGDKFCLDGKRLVAVAGAEGADGTEYRTELDSFTRVILHTKPGVVGPDYFSAKTKQGRALEYGHTADSSVYAEQPGQAEVQPVKRAWGVNRFSDFAGNYVDIAYSALGVAPSNCSRPSVSPSRDACSTQEFLPSRVTYTGSMALGVMPDRVIQLNYSANRPDAIHGYGNGGVPIARTRLLDSIETFTRDGRQRVYKLHYETGLTGLSRITSISDCAEVGGGSLVCKPATRFSYRDAGKLAEPIPTGIDNLNLFEDAKVFDWNGDGKDDLLYWRGDDSEHGAEMAIGVSTRNQNPMFDSFGIGITAFDDDLADQRYFVDVSDWNRDGRDDALMIESISGTHSVPDDEFDTTFSTLTSQASSPYLYQAPIQTAMPVSIHPTHVTAEIAFLQDMNGDGLLDLVSAGFDDTLVWKLMLQSPHDSTTPLSFTNLLPLVPPGPELLFSGEFGPAQLDVNGDGRLDLFGAYTGNLNITSLFTTGPTQSHISKTGASLYINRRDAYPVRYIDINADGAADLLQAVPIQGSPNMMLRGFLSRRDGTFAVIDPFDNFGWTQANFLQSIVYDYDGDGRDDLISPGPDTSTAGEWILHRNVPSDATVPTDHFVQAGVVPLVFPRVTDTGPKYFSMVGDYNGDGRPDIAALDRQNRVQIFPGAGSSGVLLTQINNGVGKVIDVDYSATSGGLPTYKSAYQSSTGRVICDWPTSCLRRMSNLVSMHDVKQETGLSNPILRDKFQYHYVDARTSARGDGWLGFAHRSIENYDGTSSLVERIDIDYDNKRYDSERRLFPTAGRVLKTVTTRGLTYSAPLAIGETSRAIETDNNWSVYVSDRGVPFVGLQLTTTKTMEGIFGRPPVTVSYVTDAVEMFDQYGNPAPGMARMWGAEGTNATQLVAQQITLPSFDYGQASFDKWQVGLPHLIQTLDSRGSESRTQTVKIDYDPAGLVGAVTREPDDPARTLQTTFTRKASGAVERISTVDATGSARITEVVYDQDDLFPVAFVNPLGTSQVRYDGATGELLAFADPNGVAERWAYDGFGRLRRDVAPGRDTTVDYQDTDLDLTGPFTVFSRTRTVAATAHGPTIVTERDPLGRVVRTTRSGYLGTDVIEETEYNPQGLVSRRSRPHLAGDSSQGIVSYAYDAWDRLIEETRADGTKVTRAYASPVSIDPAYASVLQNSPDAVDVEMSIDPKQHQSISALDMLGNPVRTIDQLGLATNYRYGPGNLLADVTDYQNDVTTIRRDQLGWVTGQSDPNMGNHLYFYTAFGELQAHIDGNGRGTVFQYDSLGRPFERDDADGTTKWFYDAPGANAVGRLVKMVGPTGHETAFTYEPPTATDNRGFLTSISESGPTGPLAASYHYDPATGLLDQINYPAAGNRGFGVKRGYDPHGNLVSVTNADTGVPYWTLLDADQGIRPSHESFGSVIDSRKYYYPLTGRVNHIQTLNGANFIQNLFYHYDDAGNVDIRQDKMLPASARQTETFGYDAMDRLDRRTLLAADASDQDQVQIVAYDALGNLMNGAVGTYQYNSGRPQQVSSAGSNQYTYDGNGNLETRSGLNVPGGSQSFAYTAFNLPSSIATGSPGKVTTFGYDASGGRAIKADPDGETRYLPGLYERRTTAALPGRVEHVYRVYGGTREVAQVRRSEQSGMVSADQAVYLRGDAIGSTNLIVDDTGQRVVLQRYSQFGKSEEPDTTSGVTTGFTGQEEDASLGLVNMKGRLYDPVLGRFTTPDPRIQAPFWSQGLNRYSYTWNNFLKWVDPTGFSGAPNDDGPQPRQDDPNENNPCGECRDVPEIVPTEETINGMPPTPEESAASASQPAPASFEEMAPSFSPTPPATDFAMDRVDASPGGLASMQQDPIPRCEESDFSTSSQSGRTSIATDPEASRAEQMDRASQKFMSVVLTADGTYAALMEHAPQVLVPAGSSLNMLNATRAVGTTIAQGLFVTGAAVTVVNAVHNTQSGRVDGIDASLKATGDLTVGAIATFTGPVGAFLGTGFFILDATVGDPIVPAAHAWAQAVAPALNSGGSGILPAGQ